MIVDIRSLDAGRVPATDLTIVGGGAAGISIAREFLNTRHRVAVFVSGDIQPGAAQSLADGTSVGQPYFPLIASSIRCLGGNTTHWGSWCRRFDPFDFAQRSWVPNSGWPIPFESLEPFYRRAHDVLQLGAETFDPTEATASISDPTVRPLPLSTGKVENKLWRFCKPPVCFGRDHLDELKASENVTVYLNANVTEIVLASNGESVQGLKIATLEGKRFDAPVHRAIVACGGIETPRLLLASRSVRPRGVGNDNDLVGRYFMDHPHLHHNGFIILEDESLYPTLFDTNSQYLHKVVGGICPTEAFQAERQILNCAVNFIPSTRSLEAIKQSDGIADAVMTMLDRAIAFPGHAYRSIKKKLGYKDRNIPRSRFLDVITRCEQSPNPDSRISLSGDVDAVGMPRAQLHWQLKGIEHRTIAELHKVVAQEFGAMRRGRMKIELVPTDVPVNEVWRGEGETGILNGGWHHMGTTRMSDSPSTGVVDPNCRVFGVENLWVSGASVYPTSSAFNPTMTLVALSLRLADHLKTVVFH